MLQPASHLEYGVMVLTATKFAETGCPARKNRSGGRLCVRELLRLGGIVIALLWSGVGPAVADIHLPKIFSDSMVIQRQAEVRMAGVADADEPPPPGFEPTLSARAEATPATPGAIYRGGGTA